MNEILLLPQFNRAESLGFRVIKGTQTTVSQEIFKESISQESSPILNTKNVECFEDNKISLCSFPKQKFHNPFQGVCFVKLLFSLSEESLSFAKNFLQSLESLPRYLGSLLSEQMMDVLKDQDLAEKILKGFSILESNIENCSVFIMALFSSQDPFFEQYSTDYISFSKKAISLNEDALITEFLIRLHKNSAPMDQKRDLLKLIASCDEQDFRKAVVYAGSLLCLEQQPALSFISFNEIPSYFSRRVHQMFLELEGVNIEDHYYELFGKMRNPFAFALFLSTLHQKSAEKVGPSLKSFLIQLMEGSFYAKRYRKDNSEHLRQCFKTRSLFNWTTGEKRKISSIEKMKDWILEDTDQIEEFLLFSIECMAKYHPGIDDSSIPEGLFGLMFNAKNRLLLLKNEKGCIEAFFTFRVMINEQDDPTLIVGPYQSNDPQDQAMQILLTEFAKERAIKLKLPLFTQALSNSNPGSLDQLLFTREDVCPFEFFGSKNCGSISASGGVLGTPFN